MSRRKAAEKRSVSRDSKYSNVVVSKFINYLMLDGKRSIAESIAYGAIESVGKKLGKGEIDVFEEAVENIKPLLELKTRRVGGNNYQVPVQVSPGRSLFLSCGWIISAARSRKGKMSMKDSLAMEFFDAYSKKGLAYKKREDTHKMAEANKAFVHFRW